jgi:oxygen-independent coproporphyrinogen-3 oxidase
MIKNNETNHFTENENKFKETFLEINEPFALYIHIPFCAKKCPYCDFYSVKYSKKRVDQFWAALFGELEYLNNFLKSKQIRSIYIGGGTPSLLNPDKILELFNKISSYYKIIPGTEITIEANPSSLTEEKIISYKRIGINRLSVGIQSFNKSFLKLLGRQSSPKNNEYILELINKYFDNYSADLIFALPGQTIDDFKKDINNLLKFNPPHISLYNLEIHENTDFYNKLKNGELSPIKEDLDADMYEYAAKKLTNNNYHHYEISNFAKSGFRAQHNYIYWQYQPYLALGPGASGFDGSLRYQNLNDLEDYIDVFNPQPLKDKSKNKRSKANLNKLSHFDEINKLSREDKMAEFCFLKLRTAAGLSYFEFKRKFAEDFNEVYGETVEELKKKKLLIEGNERIYLSSYGKLLANQVFLKFLQ